MKEKLLMVNDAGLLGPFFFMKIRQKIKPFRFLQF